MNELEKGDGKAGRPRMGGDRARNTTSKWRMSELEGLWVRARVRVRVRGTDV